MKPFPEFAAPTRAVRWTALAVIAILSGWLGNATADEVLRYRKIFVPEADLESQIRGLLPMKRDAFEQRIGELSRKSSDAIPAVEARVEQAKYRARLEGETLTGGHGELRVVAASEISRLLRLAPCNLAITGIRWTDDNDEQVALVGQTPTGELACLVEASGTLQFDWSLRGESLSPGALRFVVELPYATTSTLELELPVDRILTAEGGIVLPPDVTPSTATGGATQSEYRLWRVQVGGPGRVVLAIEPQVNAAPERPLVAVKEDSTYALVGAGLDLQSLLEIDLYDQQVTGLTLRVEQPLQVTSIRLGEQALTWHTVATDDESATLVIDFASSPSGGERTLEINATAAWSFDPADVLPRVSIANCLFQEGRATLVAPSWLRVRARPLSGCWQTGFVAAAPARQTEQLQFQLQDPAAQIEVSADSAPARLRERSGTQITIDAAHVSAVAIAELTSLGGDRYSVEARIPRRWLVDSVDVEPAGIVSDRLLTPSTDAGSQVLRLNLRTPLSESGSLRIVIRARHRRPAADQTLPAGFYRVATFSDVRESDRLVAVRTVEAGAQLRWIDAQRVTRLDPAALSEAQMRLFDAAPGTLLFRDELADTGLSAEVTRAPARYRAELSRRTIVASEQFHESVAIRCSPEGSPVGQVLVRLSPKPSSSINWSIDGQDRRSIEVESQVDGAESEGAPVSETGPVDGLYRIRLLRPRGEPFELRGEWSRAVVPVSPLTLASAPEASAQVGTLEVEAIQGTAYVIESDELQPQPVAAAASAGDPPTLRSRHSYRPGSGSSARLKLLPAAEAIPAAFVETLELRSRFDVDGSGEHELSALVVHRGLSRIVLRAPPGARNIRQLDARTGSLTPVTRLSADLVEVELPAGSQQAHVELRYHSVGEPRSWRPMEQFSAPLLETDLPVLSRRWSVAVGPEVQIVATGDGSAGVSTGFARRLTELVDRARSRGAAVGDNATSSRLSLARAFLAPQRMITGQTPARNEQVDPGWSLTEQDLPEGNIASVEIIRPVVVEGLSLGVLLLAGGCALVLRRSGAVLFWAAVILLAASLLVGPVAGPLAQAAAAGLFAGCAARLLVPSRLPLAEEPASTVVRTPAERAFASGSALLAIVWLAACGNATAQETAAENAAPPADERVVIAVDDDQQPIGDYVYLTPNFYERLHRGETGSSAQLPAWLIAAAEYRLPAAPREAAAAWSVDEITARFEIESFHDAAVVELPLSREQMLLLEGRARLDGAAVSVSWREDGKALLVPIDAAGTHRLELAFGAAAQKTNEGVLLDLAIPAVNRTAVSFPARAEGAPIIRSATGGALAAEVPEEQCVALGPSSKLVALWPPPGQSQTVARLEAEQLLWWKLRPGSVIVEGKFRFRPVGGAVERLSFAVDPRLRLVPGSIVPPPARTWVEEGTPALLHLELPESTAAETSVSASWLWVGASGTGNLLLPQIQARGDRLVRSWRAVSADAPLAVEAASRPPGSLKIEDFLATWGGSTAASPALVSDELVSTQSATVSVRPVISQPDATTTSEWSISRSITLLSFDTELTKVSSQRFQHRLEMPPLLKVTQVRLTSAGKPVAMRWVQQSDGAVVVTLLAPPPAQQQLSLQAEVRLGDRPRWTLPVLQIQDSQVSSRICRIFRHSDSDVQVQAAAGWLATEESLVGQRVEERGRLVAALQSDQAAPKPVALQLAANQPLVDGRLALRVAEDDGAWSGHAELTLHVSRGQFDVVRLEVPDEWSGPFEITPAVEHRLRPSSESGAQELSIWPQQAIRDTLQLTIRSALQPGNGQGIQAPTVRVQDIDSLERLLVLDTRLGGETIRWNTSGLQPAPAAAADLSPAWIGAEEEVYRVVADPFEATPIADAKTVPQPKLKLLDVSVAVRPGGQAVGRAGFYLDPGGATEATIVMPLESRIVQVTIEGEPAQCRASGLRLWRVALPTPRLPLLLEIVFDAALPPTAAGGEGLLLASPQLAGLEPEQAVWRLNGFVPHLATSLDASAADAALAHLEACAETLEELASATPADLPAAELTVRWRRWKSAFQIADRRWQSLREELTGPIADWELRRAAAQSRVAAAEQKLLQARLLNAAALAVGEEPERRPDGTEQYLVVSAAGRSSDRSQLVGQALGAPSRAPTDWLLAIGVLLVGVTSGFLWRSAAVRAWLTGWSHLVLALAGIGWWLLAPLPWLGWLAVLGACLLAVRSPWSQPGLGHPRPRLAR